MYVARVAGGSIGIGGSVCGQALVSQRRTISLSREAGSRAGRRKPASPGQAQAGSRQDPVIVPLNAALSLLSANEPGPLLPHSRGYTITTVLAAFVAPVCILIALYFRVVFRFHHSATSHCRCGFELFIRCLNCC